VSVLVGQDAGVDVQGVDSGVWWTSEQVADAAGVSVQAVRKAARAGRLVGRLVDRGPGTGMWVFDRVDALTWVALTRRVRSGVPAAGGRSKGSHGSSLGNDGSPRGSAQQPDLWSTNAPEPIAQREQHTTPRSSALSDDPFGLDQPPPANTTTSPTPAATGAAATGAGPAATFTPGQPLDVGQLLTEVLTWQREVLTPLIHAYTSQHTSQPAS